MLIQLHPLSEHVEHGVFHNYLMMVGEASQLLWLCDAEPTCLILTFVFWKTGTFSMHLLLTYSYQKTLYISCQLALLWPVMEER